jgi:hypothetical protein
MRRATANPTTPAPMTTQSTVSTTPLPGGTRHVSGARTRSTVSVLGRQISFERPCEHQAGIRPHRTAVDQVVRSHQDGRRTP